MWVKNLAMLEDTLNIVQKRRYSRNDEIININLSKRQMTKCFVYLPNEVSRISNYKRGSHLSTSNRIGIGCQNIDSFSMAKQQYDKYPELFRDKEDRVLVLNFANPVNPGGGVRRGARAQEEDLCRKSSLLLSLESKGARAYYEYNKSLKTKLGSDAIILTPDVVVIKDYDGNLLEQPFEVAVLTCAAPMIKDGKEGLGDQEYSKMLYDRICGILKLAAHWSYRVLVLGALGCGAFGNDAKLVSDLFYKALKDFNYGGKSAEHFFKRIDFAVLDNTEDKYNFREFSRNFDYYYRDNDIEEIKLGNNGDASECVFFWREFGENGYFSNWYESEFVMDDFCYQTVEQYLMAQKAKLFHDSKRYTAILKADNPRECKNLGRQVTPFDDDVWENNRYKILLEGVRAKFSQNENLKLKLIATGNRVIAEASPYDDIFGIKLSAAAAADYNPKEWPGRNLLGKALMEVRDELKSTIFKD